VTAVAEVELPARYVRLAGGATVQVGALAGTDTVHGCVPDAWTGSSCLACFGWQDDPRHLFHRLPSKSVISRRF
jgi:hypothetical protein